MVIRTFRNISLLMILSLLLSFSLPPAQAAHSPSAQITLLYLPHVSKGFYYQLRLGEMLTIPAGTFQMGCDPEHNDGFVCQDYELPLHTVYLDAYSINTTEVTNIQYAQCVATGGCTPPLNNSSALREFYYGNPEYADYPVTWVSWEQADAYCKWGGGHLPTEAQWEKAARGGNDTRAYPWGDQPPDCTLANFYDYFGAGYFCISGTTIAGGYPSGTSPYGALDMAGNLFEWVNDWYSTTYYDESPGSNPPGPAYGDVKVVRGGSYSENSYYLKVADRSWMYRNYAYPIYGIRCAAAIR